MFISFNKCFNHGEKCYKTNNPTWMSKQQITGWNCTPKTEVAALQEYDAITGAVHHISLILKPHYRKWNRPQVFYVTNDSAILFEKQRSFKPQARRQLGYQKETSKRCWLSKCPKDLTATTVCYLSLLGGDKMNVHAHRATYIAFNNMCVWYLSVIADMGQSHSSWTTQYKHWDQCRKTGQCLHGTLLWENTTKIVSI